MLLSVEFNSHNYFMFDEYIDDFYINIHREMRMHPFVGMKQPSPSGSTMGLGAILLVKKKGKPAVNHRYRLLINGMEVDSGIIDNDGIAYLDMPFNCYCQCTPKCSKSSLCDGSKAKCAIEVSEPYIVEAFSLASEDI